MNDYLRGYRVGSPDPASPPVTFRHMLTHTAGVGELRGPTDLFRPVIGLGAKPGKPVPTPTEYYRNGLRPAIPSGKKWAYSNHAFNTLGQLVEDISQEPFVEYMRRHVFEPSAWRTPAMCSERGCARPSPRATTSRGAS